MPAPRVSSYTYGSPRVGNAPFAAAYNLAVSNTWRVTNSRDYVPTVPKLVGYCHVDHHVMLDGKAPVSIVGEYRHCHHANGLLSGHRDDTEVTVHCTPNAAVKLCADGCAAVRLAATVGAAFEGTYAKKMFTEIIPSWFSRSRETAAETTAAPSAGAHSLLRVQTSHLHNRHVDTRQGLRR